MQCFLFRLISGLILLFTIGVALSQEKGAAGKAGAKAQGKAKAVGNAAASIPLVGEVKRVPADGQADLADAIRIGDQVYLAHVEWNGTSDSIHLSREENDGISKLAVLAEEGVFHAPALASAGDGTVWGFWGVSNDEKETVDLVGRSWSEKEGPGKVIPISSTDAAEAFVDAGVDSEGRIWVVWQSMRGGDADVYARFLPGEGGSWSEEIGVATGAGGDWEPRLAFDAGGNAWILYDSSRGNEFNLYLAKIDGDSGEVSTFPIAHSDRYEARGSLAATADGKGFWIAAERGRVRWGLDARGHGNDTGINAQKEVLFGRFDIDSGDFEELPPGPAGEAGKPVNLPEVGVGASGDPWLAYRYFEKRLWKIAITSYRRDRKTWSSRRGLVGSSYGQDRRSHLMTGIPGTGDVRIVWISDGRTNKEHKVAGVHLAALKSAAKLPDATPPGVPKDLSGEPFAPSQSTPERPGDDRHNWKVDGKSYGLYWGDLHRHTDVSNCRTGFDGCIVEHFRYAYDIAKLDFLGTSDHTDVGKFYHPYEWWHNQRMHDALHSPERFNSIYVYEREQRWPWGHRNVVFADRGGPLVYIKRALYRESPWQKLYPVKAGVGEITPPELWDILRRYEKPSALISHTGATGMGTDWGKYDQIDHESENLVEIFQGARVSYEGAGAPQPTAGLKPGETYTVNGDAEATPPAAIDDFGKYSAGTYQNALELGRKLGVFASSDHISQHVSFGGVFCESFTREGIIEAFDARRTVAATDKIYLNLTCNGELLGSEIVTKGNPKLWFKVDGTAKLKRVTLIRNEKNWKVFDSIEGKLFEKELEDDAMLEGENRYYLRVEQEDGNMAWSSPVWVTRE
ncbi:MAG: hypothetical protein P1U87_08470 [Verrucomicrobiales bacterium]|nr:hypothetical protein [Verrucomicrobiales bacterium]